MSWDYAFDDFLSAEVTREPFAGQNVHGEPSFGAAVTVICRVVYKPSVVQLGGGGNGTVEEHVSTATVYCQGVTGWGLRDRITMPDGSTPKILQVVTYPDEDGPHHQVVFV